LAQGERKRSELLETIRYNNEQNTKSIENIGKNQKRGSVNLPVRHRRIQIKTRGKNNVLQSEKKAWLETINAQNVHGKNNVRGRRGKSKRGK
jgi:hypothetical protein